MSQGTSDPHIRQTNSCRRRLESSGDIAERVVKILQFMEELHINLPDTVVSAAQGDQGATARATTK